MQGISTSIQVTDRLSPAFRTMTQSINICLGTFAQMQQATGQAVNMSAIREAQAAMNDLNMEAAKIDEELREAAEAQQKFNNAAKSGHTAVDGLLGKVKAVVGAYAGMQAVQGIVGLSDQMAETTARLNLMNDGLQTTKELQSMIYESAQASRGAYQATAAAVSKLGLMAGNAFQSNQEVIAFSEQLNKQFKIAGTSAAGIEAAMLQLTQAMGSGVLRGEEYNSILEQAPNIIQSIADYLDVPKGKLKDMAAEGAITAEVVKGAMFAAAEETNRKFAEIPMTWGDVATSVGNQALMAFQPVLEQITALASNANTQVVFQGIANGISHIAAVAGPVFSYMVDGAGWIVENWGMIEPIVWGVAAAVGAYAIQQGIANVKKSIANGEGAAYVAVTLAQAAGLAVQAVMLRSSTLMQIAYNTAVAAFPGIFLVLAIGAIVMAIAKWVQSVGGIRIAWAITVNEVKHKTALLIVGFTQMKNKTADICGKLSLTFQKMKMSISNHIGNMKVEVLNKIQDMVNGAINLINKFISNLNKIPGVAIEPISIVADFAAGAAKDEAKKQADRAASYEAAEKNYKSDKASRDKKAKQMETKANYEYANRKREIEQMKKNASEEKSEKANKPAMNTGGTAANAAANTASNAATAGNTKKIADSTEASSEDMKYLRDIAERDIIDRTVFRDIKVDLGGVVNNVSQMDDLDGIAEYLGEKVKKEMLISAEGVH